MSNPLEGIFGNIGLTDEQLYQKAKKVVFNPAKVSSMSIEERNQMWEVVRDYEENGTLSERSKMRCNIELQHWIATADELA